MSVHQVDALLVALLVPFALRGYVRGFCRESVGLVGLLAGGLAAAAWGPALGVELVARHLLRPVLADAIGCAVLFVAVNLATHLLGALADRAARALFLATVNRAAGAVFGLVKWPALRGFSFVMRVESLPFPDAVRRVASRFGIPVPEDEGGSRPRGEPLVAVNAAAAAFFQAELAGAAGARARDYLGERGVGEGAVRRFGLGYAPASGEALGRHLRAKGFPVEDCLTAGLVLRRDRPGAGAGLLD